MGLKIVLVGILPSNINGDNNGMRYKKPRSMSYRESSLCAALYTQI